MKRKEASEMQGMEFYKTAKQTEEKRNRKKLTYKTLWYKGWGKKSRAGTKLEIASVMFVQRTSNGELAEGIKKEEETLSRLNGHRVKVIEEDPKDEQYI